MGKILIKQGDIYNYLTVIGEKPEKIKNRSKWLCECKCGKQIYVPGYNLRSGKTKSCGCYSREQASLNNRKDLISRRFGSLTVIADSSKRINWDSGSYIIWDCLCDCGNVIQVPTNKLTTGQVINCGCTKKVDQAHGNNYKDLTGRRFGHLQVLYDSNIRKSSHVYWHCKCDCGEEKDISSDHLLTGMTTSCGCLKISIGEDKIKDILKELKIDYIFQKTFDDCRNPKNNSILFFDFFLPEYNIIIEYDGEQHFHPCGQRFTPELVQEIKFRDMVKNEYCKDKSIKLVRIPYYDLKKINTDFIYMKIKGEEDKND